MRTLSGVSNRSALPCAFGETVVGVDCPPRPLRDSLKALLRASPGSIVLAHDGGPQPSATPLQQLDRLVGSLMDAGYVFVTGSELLAASAREPAL